MSNNAFTNIHIRDFINEVGRDPTRPGYDSPTLHSNMHIPSVQGEELSDDFDPKKYPYLNPLLCPSRSSTSSKQMPLYIQLVRSTSTVKTASPNC